MVLKKKWIMLELWENLGEVVVMVKFMRVKIIMLIWLYVLVLE